MKQAAKAAEGAKTTLESQAAENKDDSSRELQNSLDTAGTLSKDKLLPSEAKTELDKAIEKVKQAKDKAIDAALEKYTAKAEHQKAQNDMTSTLKERLPKAGNASVKYSYGIALLSVVLMSFGYFLRKSSSRF